MPPPPLSLRPSSNNPSSEPSTPATPHGLRAQINHLIPRHSYFRARVTIHQIDSVPFVSGQFAVRWKFKQVHSPPTTGGLLGIVKTRSKNGDKRTQADDGSLDATSTASSSSSDPSLPSVIISADSSNSPTTAHDPSISSTPPFSSHTNASSSTLHITARGTSTSLFSYTASTSLTATSAASSTSTISTSDLISPARGATIYNPLKDHSVRWNQQLSTVVRLDVDRDNDYIFPCPFKLVVMQRPSHGDYFSNSGHTNPPEVHRLGAVYVNLSEYVGHGPVERRYLLRESRTNATLKLTIELEFLSGQSSYIPPPLPKGEILNGLSAYLETEFSRSALPAKHTSRNSSTRSESDPRRQNPRQHHHYHPPPNNVELYGPYLNQEELELDLFGSRCPKPKRSKSSFVMVLNRSRSKLGLASTTTLDDDQRKGEEESEESDYESAEEYPPDNPTSITIVPPESPFQPSTPSPGTTTTPTPTFSQPPTRKPTFFDVERLPMAYGTKTTETLIEAIFNPVKIDEERCESPFTVYVSPSAPAVPSLPVSLSADREGEIHTPHHPHPRVSQAKRKPVPNIEVASVYSTCSTTTTSSISNSSSTNSTSTSSSSGSRAMARSIHSQVSQMSGGSKVSARGVGVDAGAGVGPSGAGGGSGGGRVRGWWKKTVGGHGGGG